MPALPFAIVRNEDSVSIVLVGTETDGSPALIGFDPVRIQLVEFRPEDIITLVSVDPAAVYYGVELGVSEKWVERLVANRRPRYAPKGDQFPLLPEEALSGFPAAEVYLRRHRMRVPSEDAIRVSALFAVSTVRTRIDQAEIAFNCFAELYRARGRQMPDLSKLKRCFVGLQNTKTAVFDAVAKYVPVIREAMGTGYRDRELRRVLALQAPPPEGLGLAKLSFTLALLGQDTICLDARLLGVMFPRADHRTRFEKTISKRDGKFNEKAIAAYEEAEDAFLADNPHYDKRDPIGRARCQWTSWEAVGGKGAEHRVWLNLLPAA